jgi:hypothetical protein
MSKLNKGETKKVLLAAKKLIEVEYIIGKIGVDIYITSEHIYFIKGELFNHDNNSDNEPNYENIVHYIPNMWGGGGI